MGWRHESYRHSLARKGIRTSFAPRNRQDMVIDIISRNPDLYKDFPSLVESAKQKAVEKEREEREWRKKIREEMAEKLGRPDISEEEAMRIALS